MFKEKQELLEKKIIEYVRAALLHALCPHPPESLENKTIKLKMMRQLTPDIREVLGKDIQYTIASGSNCVYFLFLPYSVSIKQAIIDILNIELSTKLIGIKTVKNGLNPIEVKFIIWNKTNPQKSQS